MRGYSILLTLSVLLLGTVVATAEETCTADGVCTNDSSTSSSETDAGDCVDKHDQCVFWASVEECEKNAIYMYDNCVEACNLCDLTPSQRRKKQAKLNEAKEAPSDVTETPYGVKQNVNPGATDEEALTKIVQNVTNYMDEIVFKDPGHAKVKNDCKNRNTNCAFWALSGECDANPGFMTIQCAPTCYTCHLIDFDSRCPYDDTQPTILNPGDLHKMFERLTTDEFYVNNYQPTIHMMPNPTSEEIKKGPWVVTLENLLTDEECDRLIQLGENDGYEISMDVGPKKFDGSFEAYANDRRTSTNAWCQDECFDDTTTQAVLAKIENATGVPDVNSEYLQLLRYEEGQFYKTHHDYISHHTTRQEGVRILTVFLYLNDVEAGGGTDFPKLGLTIMPKKGRALIWPSVLNDDPNKKDPRTDHQALPVEKGLKFGANAWLHQRDFKGTFKRGCH